MKKIVDFIKKLFGKSDSSDSSSSQGFTLIELLVVIAVIGVLAAAVLIAIDPVQQLARGRDSGRKQNVSQLGRALQAYYTVNGAYPAIATWGGAGGILVTSGELKTFPTDPGGSPPGTACTGGNVSSNMCYKTDLTTDFVVYSRMESKSENSKGVPTCAAGVTRWYVYSSAAGRAGIACQAGEPPVGFNGTFY